MAAIRHYFWAVVSFMLVTTLYAMLYLFNTRGPQRTFQITPSMYNTNRTGSSNDCKSKLLVIFTTFTNSPNKFSIHRNVIMNWATISPRIQPILFGNLSAETELGQLAIHVGWKLHPIPRQLYLTGPPFLKDMYRIAKSLFTYSMFYGFCNGDILFNDGLLTTLDGVLRYGFNSRPSMIVGQRTNLKIDENTSELFSEKILITERAEHGQLFGTSAQDYFFISRPELFPWHTIKDVVIGRPAYDNYFLAQAMRGKVAAIDATKTLLALHQTGKDGNYAGADRKHSWYNKNIIGPYKFNLGFTDLCPYVTASDIKGYMFLQKRIFKKAKPTSENPTAKVHSKQKPTLPNSTPK